MYIRESVEAFLEQLIIRRELSDNYCYYQKQYDKFEAAADWAKETVLVHQNDKKEHLYTLYINNLLIIKTIN